MAKALFTKNQRVWVESVGAWAVVERVVPAWTNGVEEPTRVTYDVGLGRMFHAAELAADARDGSAARASGDQWRVTRGRNKWGTAEDTAHHPLPGSHPVVLTDPEDWGGWRAPRAEYDRDPQRIEAQARLIANAPRLHGIVLELITLVAGGAASPEALRGLARRAAAVELELRDLPHFDGAPAAKAPAPAASPAAAPPLHRSPPASGMTAASLTERMAALERELNHRPAAPGAAPPPSAPPKAEREFFATPPAATFAHGRPK